MDGMHNVRGTPCGAFGSEIFLVYTDERDTTAAGYPGLRNQAFVIKVNRLFRF
jgi:hypothetical protein